MAHYSMRRFHSNSTVIQDTLKIGQKYTIVPRARERVSERASERTIAAARERASSAEQVSERCERTSERMSEWLITNVPIVRGVTCLTWFEPTENYYGSEI